MTDPHKATPKSTPSPAQHEQLARLWTGSQPIITGYIRSLVNKPEDAEDLLQQVAMTVASKADGFPEEPHRFTSWSLGIAKNKVLHYWRDHKYKNSVIFNTEIIEQIERYYGGHVSDYGAIMATLEKCVSKLTRRARLLLQLRYVRDMRPKEMGERLGISPRGISVTLLRIRRSLRDCIERNERQQTT